jgi:hypothetical protein
VYLAQPSGKFSLHQFSGSGRFEKAACTSTVGVILSVAAFQAERRISRLTGPARKPNCTTTEIQNLRKLKTLGNPK